ncbi:uncharacterized protein MELLADRAFT_106427 [Melampsora larici-populina 98AG31]|uniref:Uncharacterized protein n=1 Tax=Melampsora larici-populina (strain 98AG31 / pathotype 3-4-7) TaxID=747676 RepID=F4RLC8_MELLP|nr:uncharacterized protein MELLADRAFT_106427 [Melampsora larici-populina 98AG31]EGG06892.1 hypothetical protein MELLADRAFT_106427 [Melampsora larici-populina 98AG31]
MEEPIQLNPRQQSKSKEVQRKESEEEKFDVADFQAKLDTSLGNLYRLVDSWIPPNLRTTTAPLSSRSFEPLKPALQPRLGLGAKPKLSEITSSNQLRNQLLKRKSSNRFGEDSNSVSEELKKEEEEEDQDQDSRTKISFGSKDLVVDRFLPRSKIKSITLSDLEENPLKLSKKQLKKRRKLEKLSEINPTNPRTDENDEVSSCLQTEVSTSMRTTPDTERTPSLTESSSQSISSNTNNQPKNGETNTLNPMISNLVTKPQKEISLISKTNHLTSIPSTPESDIQKTNPSNPITLTKQQIKKQRNKLKKKLKRQELKDLEEKSNIGEHQK